MYTHVFDQTFFGRGQLYRPKRSPEGTENLSSCQIGPKFQFFLLDPKFYSNLKK